MDDKVININGQIDITNNPVDVNEFWELFIEFIENNKWYFGGSMEIDNDG